MQNTNTTTLEWGGFKRYTACDNLLTLQTLLDCEFENYKKEEEFDFNLTYFNKKEIIEIDQNSVYNCYINRMLKELDKELSTNLEECFVKVLDNHKHIDCNELEFDLTKASKTTIENLQDTSKIKELLKQPWHLVEELLNFDYKTIKKNLKKSKV